MAAVHFYHLTTTPLERALPKLLEKAYSGGFRTLLVTNDEERAQQLSEWLWVYDPNSFLPHGSIKEPHQNKQPILITNSQENVNQANILFITNGLSAEAPATYDRVIDLFDGSNDESLQAARNRWKNYKEQGIELVYQQQTESGGWQKKAA